MFDIGWSELLLVAVIAIIVVGPKDLPRALRTMGQWASRMRAIAREFQSNVDEMIRDSELDEIAKEAKALTDYSFDPGQALENHINPEYEVDTDYMPPAEGDAVTEATEVTAATQTSAGEVAAEDAYAVEGAVAPPHSLGPRPPEAAPGDAAVESVVADEADEALERPSSRANG